MAKEPGSQYAQVIHDIAQSSAQVSKLATELSACVETFQDWLATIPGKVEASVWFTEYEDEFSCGGVRFCKWNGKWRLMWITRTHVDVDDRDTLEQLTDASVDKKLIAVRNFAVLLEQMVVENARRAKEIEVVKEEFAALAKEIGLKEKTGGK